jgi:hypothetical protein
MAYGVEFSQTHPSAQMRIENIRRYFKSALPSKLQTIIDESSVIQEIMTSLWNINKDSFNYTVRFWSKY